MKKLIGLIGVGIFILAFPAIAAASSNVNVSTTSVSDQIAMPWFDGLWFGIPDGAIVNSNVNTAIATGGSATANATAVAQSQSQSQGGGNSNGGTQEQNQDISVNAGGQNGVTAKVTQHQSQTQGTQVAQVTTPTLQSGTLPSTGAEVAVPGALATLGTSIVAYLKHKKRMISLAFMSR